MSVRLMGAIFDLEIPSTEKLVLLAMADHARDDGTGCYPSIERLARKTSQSRRGVQGIMRRLENSGLIAPERISRGRRSTEYRITLDKPNRTQPTLFNQAQPRTPEQRTANLNAPNREPGSPESLRTVLEPSSTAQERRGGPTPSTTEPKQQLLFEGEFLRISASDHAALMEGFPDFPPEELLACYRDQDLWQRAHPARRKRNHLAGMRNWMQVERERKGRYGVDRRNQSSSGAVPRPTGKQYPAPTILRT